MSIDDLTTSIGEWLRGTGPLSDIVVSSRVRLARNLAGHPQLPISTFRFANCWVPADSSCISEMVVRFDSNVRHGRFPPYQDSSPT